MGRYWIGSTLLLLSLLVFLTTASAETKDEMLRLSLSQAPTTLIPHISTGFKDRIASRIVYEPLASHDVKGDLVPILAAEIPSLENGLLAPDGMSVTWKLKPGVHWSDGQPFTADDVIFTFDFIMDPSLHAYSARYYQSILSVVAVDALTVNVAFKKPTPLWAQPFVGDSGVILPRHIYKNHMGKAAYKAPQKLAAVGTGPYRLKSFDNEEMLLIGDDLISKVRILYEANPLFREQGKPFFKTVEIRSHHDTHTAVRSVITEGTIDFTWAKECIRCKSVEEMMTIKKASIKGRFWLIPDPKVERIMFNFSDPDQVFDITDPSNQRVERVNPHPIFSDQQVRKAFAHAIDRKAIAALYGDKAEMTTNLVVIPEQYNSPNTRNLYPFDLDFARELLDAAGWKVRGDEPVRVKDGRRLSVVYQTSVEPLRQKIQYMVKENLEAIGVEVNLKFIDPSVFFNSDPSNLNSLATFNADMQQYSFGNILPDPAAYLGFWICRSEPSKPPAISSWNKWEWCNPSYDALGWRLGTELDPKKRQEIYIKMNDMLVEEAVALPLVNPRKVYAVSRSLEGVELTPWDRETWKIKDWRRVSIGEENERD